VPRATNSARHEITFAKVNRGRTFFMSSLEDWTENETTRLSQVEAGAPRPIGRTAGRLIDDPPRICEPHAHRVIGTGPGRRRADNGGSMSKGSGISILIATAVASLAICASAQAANVTVGSPLSGAFITSSCPTSCTLSQTTLPAAGTTATSPVTGAIIRWRMTGGAIAKNYKLRVLTHGSGLSYTGSGTSAGATPKGAGVETFSTDLPIQAGQLIGIDLEAGAPIGYRKLTGAKFVESIPPFVDGAMGTAKEDGAQLELGFNAEVQPAPTITALGSTSGSTAGGTSVTISGTDFEGTSAVKFGTLPAASFTVNSESQITAVAPAAAAGAVNVAVTTVAGTATSAQQFTSTAPAPTCTVPKLTAKKLKAAKKGLTKADCKLGKLTKKKGATAKTGKVVKQSPKAGKVLPAGSKVSVRLGV
jgi:IPT/TIG domain/PASTA domain